MNDDGLIDGPSSEGVSACLVSNTSIALLLKNGKNHPVYEDQYKPI